MYSGWRAFPHACLQIDATFQDHLHALRSVALNSNSQKNRHERARQVEHLWSTGGDTLVSLSVRSALDLYLRVMKFPKGSEFVMTAVNIPDMLVVVRHHGLVPVPVDIDTTTLGPRMTQLRQALESPKAVLFLAAHIYGKRVDLTECIALLKEKGIPLIEDCAESFAGLNFSGHPEAQMSVFSFGGIKVATAFGGGVSVVRDADILREMRSLQSTYPPQSRLDYLKRVLKYSVVAVPLNVPAVNGPFRSIMRAFAIDYQSLIVGMVRGFPDRLIERLREAPCAALLDVLHRQLSTYQRSKLAGQTAVGDLVARGLPPSFIAPGQAAMVRDYWLFPVMVDDPASVMQKLNRYGIDAYQGATQLALVEPEEGTLVDYPREAARMMRHTIYLPVHRRVPVKDALTLIKLVQRAGSDSASIPPTMMKSRL